VKALNAATKRKSDTLKYSRPYDSTQTLGIISAKSWKIQWVETSPSNIRYRRMVLRKRLLIWMLDGLVSTHPGRFTPGFGVKYIKRYSLNFYYNFSHAT
jgi:hypothetical protein